MAHAGNLLLLTLVVVVLWILCIGLIYVIRYTYHLLIFLTKVLQGKVAFSIYNIRSVRRWYMEYDDSDIRVIAKVLSPIAVCCEIMILLYRLFLFICAIFGRMFSKSLTEDRHIVDLTVMYILRLFGFKESK